MVKFVKNRPADGTSGPSSAIGIMRFFDADSKSPQLNPYFVIGATIAFIILVLALKFIMA